ncbi:DUF4376 domain-containing protein [Acetonema longum]|uniref:DUF4376 domain-containing protein n=1 Tax=Acetonema longum DSM 6540 TaxID=1009370 RepID=F7NFU4_9FIRM|nr:DUF4376 domain-containing protein [Acetonema longum]EGO65090.1 hypothetical protein ALO_04638 [Acetonema longum DSM 6540]
MLKLAKIADETTKEVVVAISDTPDEAYFLEQGYTWQDVEEGFDLHWYLTGQAHQSTLDKLKIQSWERIKEKRDMLEQSGVPYMGKVLDSNSLSVQRIAVAVQAAQAAITAEQDFSLDWTCADNTVLTMTAQEAIGISVTLAQHANTLHQIARNLRLQIDAAETAEELGKITWPE